MSAPRRGGGSATFTRAVAVALLVLLSAPSPAEAVSCLTASPLFTIDTGGGTALRQPSDLALRGDRLFVLDDLNGRVAIYSLGGKYLSSTPLPGGRGQSLLGLDVGGDDNLYLAASGEGKVIVLTQKGKVVREFATGGEGGSPTEPTGVDVSRGQCIVADNEGHGVKVFDLEGNLVVQWGQLGEGPLGLRFPFRLLQDSLGRVIVTDTLNSMIKIFTPRGEPLLEFGEFGVTEGTLYRPVGIALRDPDQLLVADNYHGAIQLFDLRGQYLATLCGGNGKPLLFRNPVSLAARGSTLFVLEMGAGQVRALELR